MSPVLNITSTQFFSCGGYSSVGRASDCDSECRGFKPRYSPQFSLPLNSRLSLNSRNHLQVNSISYIIFTTASVTESYSSLPCLAILGYSLAIRKNRESRFYQGFQSLRGKSQFSQIQVLAIETSIKESIQSPILPDGLWMRLFAAAASFFNSLRIRSAHFFLLTTHSQQVESRWSARWASKDKSTKNLAAANSNNWWEWFLFFYLKLGKGI